MLCWNFPAQLPGDWDVKLDSFQRLLLLRVLRPDKLVAAVRGYVQGQLGQRFVEPPPFDLDACFADSGPLTPLIFVLSPGSDPMAALLKYAEAQHVRVSNVTHQQGSPMTAFVFLERTSPAAAAPCCSFCGMTRASALVLLCCSMTAYEAIPSQAWPGCHTCPLVHPANSHGIKRLTAASKQVASLTLMFREVV
jgi:dynein heavy chain